MNVCVFFIGNSVGEPPFLLRVAAAQMVQAVRLLLAGLLAGTACVWPKIASASEFAAASNGFARPAQAVARPVSLTALRFPAGSRHELLADQIWLHGMPAQVLAFDAPLSASELIRFLSGQQPALADLNVLPGQAILSGQIGHEQWVVQMEGAGPRRTVGSISTLNLRTIPVRPEPAWLPAGARLRLDVGVLDQGVKVTDRIWQYDTAPASVAPRLESGLRRDGWLRPLAAGEPQWWTKGTARLRISLVPLDGGSGLLVRGWAP